ncbi:hypothetical protein Patl1_07825 [Pistacia atlantica]|uniref:Uncharacterized protein n=1 Tax=Pistacia atlantica TaxID=434234 RepID=A0ACC1AEF7_9ROSI|nr:hypothetical protein Patl1_07825 [Pistacia atlantica]
MFDRPRSMSTQEFYDRAPTSYLTVKFLTAAVIVLVLFSPILIRAGIVTFLAAAEFLFSGGGGVTALTLCTGFFAQNWCKREECIGMGKVLSTKKPQLLEMAVVFGDLNSAFGLKKLDEYLLTRSYITG